MLTSPTDWQAIVQRARLPAFRPALERLHADVATFLAQPLAVQAEPGGYYHDYFCPEHGVQFVFDAASPTAHRCPLDQAIWREARFDAAWRWFVNNRLSEAAIRLALLGRLTGETQQVTRVQQILHDYARHYAGYRQGLHSPPNPGIATFTTLDEAVWILPLVWAFDLIRAMLSQDEVDYLTTQLFAPAAEHLISHHFAGIHNFACWHNAAIGTIGVALQRPDLVDFAVHGEYGFTRQLKEGVLADGLWFEGSFSYHFYTLAALLALTKATRHLPNLALHQHPAVRIMLLAPIQSAYPDWSMPATNDCWYFTSLLADCCHGVPPAPAFYEVGYAWYGDPHFAQVLQRAYAQSARDSLDALLFGALALPEQQLTPLRSQHLAASGYAILREMPSHADALSDEQRYLLLKYGPHGGGHGHPDKLNLILYAYGQRFAADLGTPGYGLDLFESWYRQTVSHNTITLDGRSQPEANGQLHAFRGDGPFQVADASVTWRVDDPSLAADSPYRGATLRRVLLARPDYFLDILLVDAPQAGQIDWVFHNVGALHHAGVGQPMVLSAADGEGYQHMTEAQYTTGNGVWQAHWQIERGGLHLFATGEQAEQVIRALTPGNPPTQLRSALIRRRQATTTLFLALFHPYQHTPQVTNVEWLGRSVIGAGWSGCVVQVDGRQEQWLLRLRPEQAALPVTNPAVAWFAYSLVGTERT
jgi:hypothetical protein